MKHVRLILRNLIAIHIMKYNNKRYYKYICSLFLVANLT